MSRIAERLAGERPRVAAWQRDAAALVAGAALPLAFAPFDLYLLAPAACALAFAALGGASPRRGLWRGWLMGLGLFGVGVSWVHESFQFSNVGPPLSVLLTAALVALLALYPALVGYADARLFGVGPVRRLLLLLPAAWVLVEWVRGWFLSGFTWLQLGYSQIDSPLAGLLPLVGVYGVGWVVAASGGLLVLALRERGHWLRVAVPLVAGVWVVAGLLRGVAWTGASGAPVEAALVQGNISQDIKWRAESRDMTLARYARLTRAHWGADLVVWPETALPGFYREFAGYLGGLAEEARAHGTDLLAGAVVRDATSRRYYNSLIAIGANPGIYHKRHLVPFGEYLPWRGLLGGAVDFLGIPMSNFSPGPPGSATLRAGGHPVAATICYEIAFAPAVRRALPRARFLVNVSNDAWFGDSIAPHQHLQMARVRARESGRDVVRATNTGISAVIAADGTVRARGPQFEPAVVTAEVVPRSGATPYVRVGDAPVLAALGVVLVAGRVAGGGRLTRRRRR